MAQHPLAVWGFNPHSQRVKKLPHRYVEIIDIFFPVIDDYRGIYCGGLHYPLLHVCVSAKHYFRFYILDTAQSGGSEMEVLSTNTGGGFSQSCAAWGCR